MLIYCWSSVQLASRALLACKWAPLTSLLMKLSWTPPVSSTQDFSCLGFHPQVCRPGGSWTWIQWGGEGVDKEERTVGPGCPQQEGGISVASAQLRPWEVEGGLLITVSVPEFKS